MASERATKKQQELLSFIDSFIKGTGYGPSYREIMRSLGYKSVSTVATHVDGLIAKGYLIKRDNTARSLEVVGLTTAEVNAASVKELTDLLRSHIEQQNLTEQQLAGIISTLRTLKLSQLADELDVNPEA